MKEADAAMEKALQQAKEIKIPGEVLARESPVEAAQLRLELRENLQQMAVADDMVEATEVVQKEAGCSEAVALEAPKGNTDSLHTTAEIVNIESNTSSDTRSSPASLSSYSSTSSDMDDIPLHIVYGNLNKSLSPSPSTKTQKNPYYGTFVLM